MSDADDAWPSTPPAGPTWAPLPDNAPPDPSVPFDAPPPASAPLAARFAAPPPPAGRSWTDAPPPASAPLPPAGSAPEAFSAAPRAWAMPEVGEFADPFGTAAPVPSDPGARSAAPTGGSATTNATASAAATAVPPVRAPLHLPVPLQPMTLSDLLDGAWAILKARPRTVLAVTAMIVVPIELLAAFLQHGAAQVSDIDAVFNGTSGGSGASGLGLLGSALSALSYFFLGGALSRLVSTWYAGQDLTVRDVMVATLRKSHIWVAAFLLLLIPKAIAMVLLVLPIVFVIPLFMLTAPAIMIEGLGPVAGALRSVRLVWRRYLWCLGVWLLSFVLASIVEMMLGFIPQLLSGFVPVFDNALLVAAFAVVAKLVTAPFVVGVCILLYLDVRVRTEGLDLELGVTNAFAGPGPGAG